MKRLSTPQFRFVAMEVVLLALVIPAPVPASAEDVYLDTLVKLRVPKKESKRSTEGGLEHVPFRIWLPEGVKTIRGVAFDPFYTKSVTQKHWQAACRHWGFGMLAANFFGAKNDEIPGMINIALATFAKESGHAELTQAKMCPKGMSAGAGMSTRIAEHMPDRVIAVGPVCLEVGPRDARSMEIPMLTVFGDRDGKQYERLMAKLPEARAQGGLFGIAPQWGRKHEFARANNLIMLLFDTAIRQRLGKPGEPLKPFDEKDGWLGDVSQWQEGGSAIAPYAEFKGDKTKACWFPDAKTAHAWQAFVTFKPQLKLKNPPGLGDGQPFILRKVGEAIEVEVAGQPKTAGPIEVFSGADKLGELKVGKLTVKFSKPGFYPLYLKAQAEDGSTLRSRPNTLIVN
ncbi:MAG: hypothetical protein VX988_04775 [Planctomycetota bacterium]|nr:hypothetical protein [Planctomycetota bacterium]